MTFASELSIGLYAPAFPRDPLYVNVYLEHVLLGQSIEPLFTIGDDGQIKGGVAERWDFKENNTVLTIHLRKGLTFSNGQPLTSADVIYTIERNRTNPLSQSFNYLKVIKSIDRISADQIKITLHHQYVPFLLTLTRDHLGIIPHDWKFNADSTEPYAGTGPYKIIKENDQWFFVANPFYRAQSSIKIKRWKIAILDTAKNSFPKNSPDLILLSPKPAKEMLFKRYLSLSETHQELKSFSFVQYSYWWLKENYDHYSLEERKQIRSALNLLSDGMVQSMGGSLSTGIIPEGISGALPERQTFDSSERKKITVTITVPQLLKEIIQEHISSNKLIKTTNVTLNLSSYNLQDISKIKDSNCNLALISYAGGFFDPEGYLTVLPSMLGRTNKVLFGEKAETLRVQAEGEFNGLVRSELYRNFSQEAQKEVRYVSGWVPEFSEFRSNHLAKQPTAFKYSYKLVDYYSK